MPRPNLAAGRPSWRSLALGAALALALAAWVLRRVDLDAVRAALATIGGGWVALAATAQVGALVVRGVRWRTLLRRKADVPLAAAVAATFRGWVLLAVVPARLGELARPWMLARRHAVDRGFALGTLLLERLLDVGCLLALLAVYLGLGAPHADGAESSRLAGDLGRLQQVLLGGVAAALAALVATVAAAPRIERFAVRRLVVHGGSPIADWLGRARTFAAGVTAIRSRRALALAVVESAALWGLAVLGHACLFRAFELPLAPLAIAPLVVFIVLGAAIPVPAAIGSYHAAVQVALASLLGLPLATATAYAIVAHAVAYLPNLAIGALLFGPGETPSGASRDGRREARGGRS